MPQQNDELIDIFDYDSLEGFLDSYVTLRRSRSAKFSLGAFAKKLRLKDTSSISKILSGKRNSGTRLSQKLINHFNFDTARPAYLEGLIALRKIPSGSEEYHTKKVQVEIIRI